jgi:hypothetical protein
MPGFLDGYEPVEDRLAKFWEEWPNGQIVTEMLPAPEGQWVVRAEVFRHQDHVRPDATGLAQEVVTAKGVNSTSALENCETSAIGRALANLGYAPKGARPSREEMEKTKRDDTPSRPEHATWLADQIHIFKAWDEDERRLAYTAAMKRIGLETMASIEDAHRVFDEMGVIYSERPLQDDALPLEEK